VLCPPTEGSATAQTLRNRLETRSNNPAGTCPAITNHRYVSMRTQAAVGEPSAAASAARPPVSVVTVRLEESRRTGTFDLCHPYFEVVYAPLLGPAATLLARALARRLREGCEGSMDLRSLALEVGLRSSAEAEPLGRNSSLRRAFGRLEHLHIVRLVGSTLHVRPSVPPVPDRLLGRLPAAALSAHQRFVGGR